MTTNDEARLGAADLRLGAALQRLIEIASRDEQGLAALEAVRDAIDAGLDRRRAEEQAICEAEAGIVPMDRTSLASLIDRATESHAADDQGTLAAALTRAAGAGWDSPAASVTPSSPEWSAIEWSATSTGSRVERDAILPGLAERAQVKADLARACAAAIGSGVPVDASLVHRARSVGASTWIADLVGAVPHDLLILADCFAVLAEVAEYASALRRDDAEGRERFPHAVRGMAAVLSALRIASLRFRRTADEDQLVGFKWLRETTEAERIFVPRHMRLEDPYDPEEVGAIVDDIHDELEAIREATARRERHRKAIGRVRYHAGLIGRERGTDRDRQKVIDAVEELVAGGLPPSNVELRDILLPVRAELLEPDSATSGYGRVLGQLDLHLSRKRTVPEEEDREEEPSPQVKQVAERIRGTELVIIGGEARGEAAASLKEAFGLSGVTWLHLDDDPSNEDFARAIARDEVSVVVLLIRWARHRYGDAKDVADIHGKPFVRATGGYNKNAIAAAILEQASERLATPRGALATAVQSRRR